MRPFNITTSAAIAVVWSCQVAAVAFTAQDIGAAILGKPFPAATLSLMDANRDGKLDVNDVVKFQQPVPLPTLLGQWIINASYTGAGNAIPIHYAFSLRFTANPPQAVTASLEASDPSKNLTQQTTYSPTPGGPPAPRPRAYHLTKLLPVGLTFTQTSASGALETWTSQTVTIPANDPANPVGSVLQKKWVLTIDRAKILQEVSSHGRIVEQITVQTQGNGLPTGLLIQPQGDLLLTFVRD